MSDALTFRLDLFQFGGDGGYFGLQPRDIARFVGLLFGAYYVFPHFAKRIDTFLNDRPRKCLGWSTPREKMTAFLGYAP